MIAWTEKHFEIVVLVMCKVSLQSESAQTSLARTATLAVRVASAVVNWLLLLSVMLEEKEI